MSALSFADAGNTLYTQHRHYHTAMRTKSIIVNTYSAKFATSVLPLFPKFLPNLRNLGKTQNMLIFYPRACDRINTPKYKGISVKSYLQFAKKPIWPPSASFWTWHKQRILLAGDPILKMGRKKMVCVIRRTASNEDRGDKILTRRCFAIRDEAS